MKLIPSNIDYCLLQFDAMKFFLSDSLQEGSLPNFNFFSVNHANLTPKSEGSLLKLLGYKFSQHSLH